MPSFLQTADGLGRQPQKTGHLLLRDLQLTALSGDIAGSPQDNVVFSHCGTLGAGRWATPLYSITLNGLNSANTGAKVLACITCLLVYLFLTTMCCKFSMKNFVKVDI